MKRSAVALGVLTLISLGATVWMAAIGAIPLGALFADSHSLLKLLDMTLAAVLVAALVVGMAARRSSGGFLDVIAWAGPAVGALGAAYGAFNTWQAMQVTNTTRLEIVAPSFAEALLVLTLGLLAGAVAAFLNGRKAAATT